MRGGPFAFGEARGIGNQIRIRGITRHAELLVDPRHAIVESGRRVAGQRHEFVVKINLVDCLDLVAGKRQYYMQILVCGAGRAEINDGPAHSAFAVNNRARGDWIANRLRAV